MSNDHDDSKGKVLPNGRSARTEAPREPDGTFKRGVSGNPAGRPKGSRNQITLLKESLELQLREQGRNVMPQIFDKAVELALEGDRTMLKLLLELHMSKGTTQDAGKGVEKVEIKVSGPSSAKKESDTQEDSPAQSDDSSISSSPPRLLN